MTMKVARHRNLKPIFQSMNSFVLFYFCNSVAEVLSTNIVGDKLGHGVKRMDMFGCAGLPIPQESSGKPWLSNIPMWLLS